MGTLAKGHLIAGGWTGLAMSVPQSANFISKLLATCPDCVYVYDLVARQAVYRNRSLHSLLGFSDRDVECPWALIPRQLIHPDDRLDVEELLSALQGLPPGAERMVNLRVADRQRRWRHVRIRMTPLERTTACGTVRILGVITDVSEQKWAEERAEKARSAAERASNAKSHFLAQVSHELRTPLNAVVGATSLLVTTGLSAEQREYAEAIECAASTMTDLVNDVLDLGRIEDGRLPVRRDRFDLFELLDSVTRTMAPRAAAKGIILCQSLAADLPASVFGDVLRLRQVLHNLVSNALKFTERGHVELSVTWGLGTGTTRPLVFRVTDTGVGIPLDEQARLFKKYEQGQAAQDLGVGGTGLGLAISHGLVRAMGGRIACHSAPGRGSVFTVEVPIAFSGQTAARAFPAGALISKRLRILSDYEASARALRSFLLGLGAEVEVAIIDERGWSCVSLEGSDGVHAVIFDRRKSHGDLRLEPREAGMASKGVLCAVLEPVGPAFDRMAAQAKRIGALCLPQPPNLASLSAFLASGKDGKGAAPAPTPAPPLGLRVLVVDDNEANRRVLGRMLETCGCAPAFAANGADAVTAIRERAFDLILMDCQMPVMDGFSAARAIREGRAGGVSAVTIVGLTANVSASARSACRAAGMNDVIAKPLHLAALRAILQQWRSAKVQLEDPVHGQTIARPNRSE